MIAVIFHFIEVMVSAAVGVLAYMAKQMWDSKSEDRKMDRDTKLLAINKEMMAQNMTPERMQELRDAYSNRNKPKRKPQTIEKSRFASITPTSTLLAEPQHKTPEPEFNTLDDMRKYILDTSHKLDDELNKTLDSLTYCQDHIWESDVMASQTAWLKYRNEQADLVSSQFEDNIIASYIYIATMNDLTEVRITELHNLIPPSDRSAK